MSKTRLHYSDLLSVVDGRLVSLDGIDGVYKTCDALAGPGVTTIALMYLQKPLSEHLRRVFPKFANPSLKAALDTALARWKTENPTEESRKQKNVNGVHKLKRFLDSYVLPLLDGEEYYEVEHLSDEDADRLGEGYEPFLKDFFKGKKVIAVVAPEPG